VTKYGQNAQTGRLGRPQTNSVRFGEEIEELVQLIDSKWGKIPIGLFSVKPHSELVNGELNKRCEQFNESLQSVAVKHDNITYIDMYKPMLAALGERTTPIHPDADVVNHITSVERMMWVRVLRALGYSYNDIGDARGFYLFCDGLHFNERGAEIVLNVIQPFIDRVTDK
jgi:lysophospholipase L1-like esterase